MKQIIFYDIHESIFFWGEFLQLGDKQKASEVNKGI
jgi:hypothetical protein